MRLIKDILGETSAASCVRFCVLLVVVTICFNYTIGTFAAIIGWADSAGISGTELGTLATALTAKLGQKEIERRKNKGEKKEETK